MLSFDNILRGRPFVPFRIFATDGRTFDVRHPDQALVLRTRVILPLPAASDEFAERSEHLALVHVVRLEELSAGSSSPAIPAGRVGGRSVCLRRRETTSRLPLLDESSSSERLPVLLRATSPSRLGMRQWLRLAVMKAIGRCQGSNDG